MTKQRSLLALACACALGMTASESMQAVGVHRQARNVRSSNARIHEVLRYALTRSPSFQDVVATLDLLDRVVYIEEGQCRHREQRSCLQLIPGGKNLLVQVDPRLPLRAVVGQLAHELYHAVEIAREPGVADPAALETLYQRIGEPGCFLRSDHCWETRAARAFEALVMRQLSGPPTVRGELPNS